MSTVEAALAAHPFFQGVDPALVARVATFTTPHSVEVDQPFFREGEPADAFYLLTHGRVAFLLEVPGRGFLNIETLDAGEVMGWSWAVAPHKWAFTATALDLTRALRVDGGALRAACQSDHELGYQVLSRLMGAIADRLAAARLQILDLYGAPGA
jgi:CRP-like cAMP-binding protein